MDSAWSAHHFSCSSRSRVLLGAAAAALWITDPGEWLGLSVFAVVGVVTSVLNETWRRATVALAESERREREARSEVEQAGRLKDDFLAVLSHELRTPLNAVIGYAQILLNGGVPPDRTAHALQAIQRNAQAQVRLVESLLDLSRVLAGKLELNCEVVELSTVAAVAVDAVTPDALQRKISLRVSGTDRVRLFADGPRLQQVFWNLLSNAIKFTPAGGHVTVDLSSTDTEAVIRIKDDGRGMTEVLLPFVFDRFKQGEGESSGSRTGLGLVVTVRLPLLLPRDTGLPATPQPIRTPRADLHESRPNVLIVDDERDAREMLALALKTRGAKVRHVGTATEAFNSMLKQRPDILLSDLGMPGEDGHSLIRRWRTNEGAATARVAAIAVTAYASATDRERALAAGFDWHIAKPIDVDELVRIIAALQAQDRASDDDRLTLDAVASRRRPH